MEVTFLGTGTSQGVPVIGCDCEVCLSTNPKDHRLRCAILVQINGQNILVDAGPDFRYQMLRAQVKDIDAILITHEHRDHIAGLDDVRPINFRYEKDMPIYATKHVQKELEKAFYYIFTKPFYPGVPRLVFHTIEKNKIISFDGLQITPIEVMHGQLPVMGFRFGDFVYLTDVKTIAPEEMKKIKGVKVLVLSALRHKPHHSHLTLEEALALIDQIKPEIAYLTHASHLLGLHEEIQAQLPPNVFLAYDGLKIDIPS